MGICPPGGFLHLSFALLCFRKEYVAVHAVNTIKYQKTIAARLSNISHNIFLAAKQQVISVLYRPPVPMPREYHPVASFYFFYHSTIFLRSAVCIACIPYAHVLCHDSHGKAVQDSCNAYPDMYSIH